MHDSFTRQKGDGPGTGKPPAQARPRRQDGQVGQTLPLLLIAMGLGVLVIAALLYAVDARLYTARHRVQRDQQQYAADAGVEYALGQLMTAAYCDTPGATTVFTLPAAINALMPTVSVRCVTGPLAGGTWVTQTIDTQNLTDVYFVDANNGWAVGANATILHTTDGGVTWTEQQPAWQFPPAKDIDGVAFKDANCGWAVGEGNRKAVQWTNDGGVHWYLTEKVPTGDLYAVTYDHTSRGWFVGENGEIWAIDCSGNLQDRTSTSIGHDLYGIDMISGTVGWVVGENGTIAKTSNGGATWVVETVGTTENFFGVYFKNSTTGWAVGEEGNIWTTSNGGTTWTRQPVTTTQKLRSISFSDANTGWIVGDGGTVLQSTDGGAHWAPFAIPNIGSLSGIYFTDPTHGWIVGSNGLLLRLAGGSSAGVYDIVSTAGDVTIAARVNASPGQSTVLSWQVR